MVMRFVVDGELEGGGGGASGSCCGREGGGVGGVRVYQSASDGQVEIWEEELEVEMEEELKEAELEDAVKQYEQDEGEVDDDSDEDNILGYGGEEESDEETPPTSILMRNCSNKRRTTVSSCTHICVRIRSISPCTVSVNIDVPCPTTVNPMKFYRPYLLLKLTSMVLLFKHIPF